jgi:hypothetical protein
MYGIMPKAKIAILDTAPPANRLNIPRSDLWLSDIRPFKACASIPGRGT